MNKFEASAQMLEICDYARYVPGYLNRQIVTLLMQNCLGVPDSVFQRLQARTALSNLNKSGQLLCFCLNLIKCQCCPITGGQCCVIWVLEDRVVACDSSFVLHS